MHIGCACFCNHRMVQFFCKKLSVLKNPADAEDAMQETFLKVVQRIDTYREGGNARSWLLSTARSWCKEPSVLV